MSSSKPTEEHKESAAPAEPKLTRVRGVRAKPGGWVWVNELTDGWATFPDRGAVGRRVQWVIGILILILIVVDTLIEHYFNDVGLTQFILSLAIFALIVALVAVGSITDDRRALGRWRARNDSALRAGGTQALRSAIRTHTRARTVGGMNILLSSLGRTDPVFSRRRISTCTVDHQWWRTTVNLTLDENHALRYRAIGLRAPAKLARVFDPVAKPGDHPVS
jgi:hypothetical protein